jgi:PEP-CTERM motif
MKPFALAAALIVATLPVAQAAPVFGSRIWGTGATTYATAGGPTLTGTSEIVAFEPATAANGNTPRLFIAAGAFVDVLDARTGARLASLQLPANSGGVNSVAIKNGLLAVAVDGATEGSLGTVAIYNSAAIPSSGSNGLLNVPALRSFTVGAVPDMITFTPNGKTLLVANEGEYVSPTNDPEGSVSVINVNGAPAGWSETKATFDGLTAAALRNAGVRIFGDPATTADRPAPKFDLEPEYIAVSSDGKTAYVGLQEANAVAIVNISNPASPSVTSIQALGFKNHALAGNGIDPSDRDGPSNTNIKGNIQTVPNLYGMHQPDGIVSFELNGNRYLVTANEGDARIGEEVRIAGGRLNLSRDPGVDANADGSPIPVGTRFSYGARSFSILDANGKLIWDSGDALEKILFAQYPDLLANNRDDDKGPEPEVVEIVQVDGKTLLFVGLERTTKGTVLAFDLTGFDGSALFSPTFLGALIDPNFLRVEGLDTVKMNDSLYLAASFEGDPDLGFATRGTSLFLIQAPEPASLALLGAGLAGLAVARRRKRG